MSVNSRCTRNMPPIVPELIYTQDKDSVAPGTSRDPGR
jgi:hypothetical protein